MGGIIEPVRARLARAALPAALAAAALLGVGCATTGGPGGESGSDGGGTASQAESDVRRRAAIRLEIASGFYQQGNYPQALTEIREALSIDPNYARAYGVLGLVHMNLGEKDKAEESFRQALKLTPDDSELNNNYGWFLCQSGRPKESIGYFMQALKNPLYRTPSMPLHNAGICSQLAGDHAAAERYFQQSFQVDPSNPVAMYNLAEIYLKRGELERARFYSKRLLTTYEPTAQTLWQAIRIERRGGDPTNLASLSTQLRRRFPESREAELLQRGEFGE